MESFIKKMIDNRNDEETHKYVVRFGKGIYARRFLMKLDIGKKIKMCASFELANDLVKFVNELKRLHFSGKVLTKGKVDGKEGKKKAGAFIYEIEESDIKEFENAYYYLLDVNDADIILKIKKRLPKPGKNEEKIDDTFCSLDLDIKYLPQLKQTFFWDVPEGKKVLIEHKLQITGIVFPFGENDPVKIRELAKRKGTIVRKIIIDGKEIEKTYEIEA